MAIDPIKEQILAEEMGLTEKQDRREKNLGAEARTQGDIMQTKEKEETKSDIEVTAEAELKRKGLKTIDQLNDYTTFSPISLDDQKSIHASDPDAWKKINDGIRERKAEALEKARKIDLEKQEQELKLLGVKRYDEDKAKPEFLCVVKGCGEEKAPGQGYHCASHSKGS